MMVETQRLAEVNLAPRARPPFGEEPFPDPQPDPSLTQLHAFPSGPDTIAREKRSVPYTPGITSSQD